MEYYNVLIFNYDGSYKRSFNLSIHTTLKGAKQYISYYFYNEIVTYLIEFEEHVKYDEFWLDYAQAKENVVEMRKLVTKYIGDKLGYKIEKCEVRKDYY